MITGALRSIEFLSAAAVAGLVLSACTTSAYLDRAAVQQEIQDWFQEGAQVTTQVTCPDNEPIKQGDQFDCTAVTPDGLTLKVQVTQLDNKGQVSWQQVPTS